MSPQINQIKQKHLYFFGPFLEEYSLARVNRGLVTALTELIDSEYQIKCGNDNLKIENIQSYPELSGSLENYSDFITAHGEPDILIYNDFPADPENGYGFSNLKGKVKGAYIAWEEDLFPEHFVREYNQELNFVLVASSQTKFILQKSGVDIPIFILPNALANQFHNHNLERSYNRSNLIKTNKKTIIFHNSSGIPRKGIDILLNAYQKAFTNEDDVSLVIKTFPNRDNQVEDILHEKNWRSGDNNPEVEVISSSSLSDQELIELYLSSDIYVSPSRAEGFNLPLLEAMRLGLPVITTGWGGQLDFVDENSANLIDYELVPAVSQLNNLGAYWAEPEEKDLIRIFQEMVENIQADPDYYDIKTKLGLEIAKNYTWENSARIFLELLPKLVSLLGYQDKKVGVMSTYNSVCGIAEYSDYLFSPLENIFENVVYFANTDAIPLKQNIEAEKQVLRIWEEHSNDFSELISVIREKYQKKELNYFHIQYNLWKFSLTELASIIDNLAKSGVPVILTPHSVRGENFDLKVIGPSLELCKAVILINKDDYNYLSEKGFSNVHYLPHGNTFFPRQSKSHLRRKLGLSENEFIVANHGFAVPSKGFVQTIQAVKLLESELDHLTYLGFTAVNPEQIDSQSVAEQIDSEIETSQNHDKFISIFEFLDRNQILAGLAAADIAIFAYDDAVETASGAIRLALAVGLPIITTDSSQLTDLEGVAYKINNNRPETIAAAIQDFANNAELIRKYSKKSRDLAQKWDWNQIAVDYLQILKTIS